MYDTEKEPDALFACVIASHELEHGTSLMLIGLHAQATLCLVKDVEFGTCYMKREKVWVEMFEVAGSNLRAIVVWDSRWDPNEQPEVHENYIESHTEDNADNDDEDDDDDVEEDEAVPAQAPSSSSQTIKRPSSSNAARVDAPSTKARKAGASPGPAVSPRHKPDVSGTVPGTYSLSSKDGQSFGPKLCASFVLRL